MRALKVEARGRDEGGEVNRDWRIRLYLEDNREPLKVHNLWRDRQICVV